MFFIIEKIGLICRNLYAPSIFARMIDFEKLPEEEQKAIVNKELDEVFNYLADLCKKIYKQL